MILDNSEWTEYQRRRWTRSNASLYLRPDPRLYLQPNQKLYFKPQPYERKCHADASSELDELLRLRSELESFKAEVKLLQLMRTIKAYNPNQPRVPAGSREGGQWLRIAGPIPLTIDPSALTGISHIDDTTKKLASIFVKVMETMEPLNARSPQLYGTAVHTAFATAVRAQNLPGIGVRGVESTFSLDRENAYYGFPGSIRTDVVLRNEAGDVLAIYDVKTGERGIDPARADELRAKTRVGPNVPVIELHVLRGVTRKDAQGGGFCQVHGRISHNQTTRLLHGYGDSRSIR